MARTIEGGITLVDLTDGQSYYTFVRYSKNADGSGYVATPTSETIYIGVYAGPLSSPPVYSDSGWTWSKYVGDDGGQGPQGVSVTAGRELYYLTTTGTVPSRITAANQIVSTDTPNKWSSVVATYQTDADYYTCIETTLSNGQKVWSAPSKNIALTTASADAQEAKTIATGINQYFWWIPNDHSTSVPAGVYMTQIPSTTFKSVPAGGNIIMRSDGMYIRHGAILDAQVTSSGLTVKKGGIEAGTFNSDNYIYAWSEDRSDRSLAINGSGNKTDWRFLAGKKFGVDKAGNLYASNANIRGVITVAAGSNVYTTDDVNPLEIGGRNLLLNTDMTTTWSSISLNTSNFAIKDFYKTYSPVPSIFEVDDLVTISFDWTTTATEGNFHVECGAVTPYTWGTVVSSSGEGNRNNKSNYVDISSSIQSGHLTVTFKVTSSQASAAETLQWLRIRVDGTGMSGKTFTVSNAKAEKGNKATDWTPAPEDVQAEIDAKKSVHTISSAHLTTGASYATILGYAEEGKTLTYGVLDYSSQNIKVGDSVRLAYAVSDMNKAIVYINGTVTATPSATTITITGHGLDTTIIDGGNILTNSIGANQIKANSITASKIAIGDFNNYVTVTEKDANSILTDGDTIENGWLKTRTGYSAQCPRQPRWTTNGESYRVTGTVKAPSAGCFMFVMYARGDTGSNLANTANYRQVLTADTETQIDTVITLNNSNYSTATLSDILVCFCTTTTWTENFQSGYIKNLKCERMSGGSLIVDGAITANKIDAEAVTAEKLAANSLTIGKMDSTLQSRVGKTITTATDLNTLRTTGIYYLKISGNTNCPTTGHGKLEVNFNVGTPYQIWQPDSSTPAYYKRYYSNSTWSAWTTIDAVAAGKTATSYITDIDSKNGVIIKAVNGATSGSDTTKQNYVKLNASGLDIYQGGNSVAKYGSTARIGRKASGQMCIEIVPGGMDIIRNGSIVIVHFGYETVNTSTGSSTSQGEAPYYNLGIRKGTAIKDKGQYSVIEGYNTMASGSYSHAEGIGATASGYASHAEGWNTIASEYATHAEGDSTIASGQISHAEGVGATASGNQSHAEGFYTTASKTASHAEGRNTTASGVVSHAEGDNTIASGQTSHAGGGYTHASRNYQTVIGKYNKILSGSGTTDSPYVSTNAAFVIGGGTARTTSDSKDIFSVNWSGDVSVNGTVVHSSDRRLKEHLSYLSNEANDFIRNLKPAYFKKEGEKHVGFYAQDVEEIDKWDCMVGEMNGYKTLGYSEIIAPLVAYCQHLEERIAKLEDK